MKDEHIVPVRTYVATFVALILLTALTTALAFVDMGRMNTVVALAIAVAKMFLVALFFMHAFYDKGLTRLVVVAGFLWLAILIVFTACDTFTRHWDPSPTGWGPSILLQQQNR